MYDLIYVSFNLVEVKVGNELSRLCYEITFQVFLQNSFIYQ